jgi:hypothetical protein
MKRSHQWRSGSAKRWCEHHTQQSWEALARQVSSLLRRCPVIRICTTNPRIFQDSAPNKPNDSVTGSSKAPTTSTSRGLETADIEKVGESFLLATGDDSRQLRERIQMVTRDFKRWRRWDQGIGFLILVAAASASRLPTHGCRWLCRTCRQGRETGEPVKTNLKPTLTGLSSLTRRTTDAET